MSFEWSRRTENETEAETLASDPDSDTDTVSFIVINDDQARTYRCVANNSVGIGTMCSIEITGNFMQTIQQRYGFFVALCAYVFSESELMSPAEQQLACRPLRLTRIGEKGTHTQPNASCVHFNSLIVCPIHMILVTKIYHITESKA